MSSLGKQKDGKRKKKSFKFNIFAFRVVVHAIISINRMQFLVRRWKKTKKTVRKAWSQDPVSASEGRISQLSATEGYRPATEELEVDLNFVRK